MNSKDNIRYLYGEPYRVVKKIKEIIFADCNSSKVVKEEYEVAETAPSPHGLIHVRKHLQPKNKTIAIKSILNGNNGNIIIELQNQVGRGMVFEFTTLPGIMFKFKKRLKFNVLGVEYEIIRIDGVSTTEQEFNKIKISKKIIIKNGM